MANIRRNSSTRNLTAAAMLAGLVSAGTGGELSASASGYGYAVPGVEYVSSDARTCVVDDDCSSTIRDQFLVISEGLQTTSANLARVLSVSRTTIYNWMKNNSAPSAAVQLKLSQLTAAADKLSMTGILPKSALALPIHNGRSFWDAFAAGEDAESMVDAIVAFRGQRASQRELMAQRLAEKRMRGSLGTLSAEQLT